MDPLVFVIVKRAGSVIDVQQVPESLAAEAVDHMFRYHPDPDLSVSVIGTWEC